jgi:hypothetical protein
MIIDKINIVHGTIRNRKYDPPVGIYSQRPKGCHFPFEGVQSERREIKITNDIRSIQKSKNLSDPSQLIWSDTSGIVVFEKLTQTLVAESFDQCLFTS